MPHSTNDGALNKDDQKTSGQGGDGALHLSQGAGSLKQGGYDHAINDQKVLQYLKENPDFFIRQSQIFDHIFPSNFDQKDEKIADFQKRLIEKLRHNLTNARHMANVLLTNGRQNMLSLNQIHDCVLYMLEADSFERLIKIVTDEKAQYFEVENISLCLECETFALSNAIKNVQFLSKGSVERLFGDPSTEILLGRCDDGAKLSGLNILFGQNGHLIASGAFLRIEIDSGADPTLLAFGSKDKNRFDESQATDLLLFFGRALGQIINKWLKHKI
ncbi:MAG: DUF484 family protein [Pseudomonadota bacterium]